MVQAKVSAQSFFFKNVGPTLEVLSYFSASRVKRMVSCLSKQGQSFVKRKKQDLTQLCVPSIFDACMTELTPISHVNQETPI